MGHPTANQPPPDPSMRQHWDRFAHEDPMHAILALDRPITPQDFLSGGQPIVNDMMAWAFAPSPHNRLLEIGCGMGRTAAHFASHFARVDAIDVSPQMVARARELSPLPNLHFHATDGTTLAFPSASFDALFSFLVLQHIPRESVLQGLFKEIARVLTPQGRAAIQLDTRPRSWLADAYKSLPDPLLPRKHRRFMRRYRRDPAAVRQWLTTAGLAILNERDPATDTHFFLLTKQETQP